MLENLTVAAQKVIKLAREEAAAAGTDRVQAPHLLLALVAEVNGGVSHVLRSTGVRIEKLRREARAFAVRRDVPLAGSVELGAGAREALALAVEEAKGACH